MGSAHGQVASVAVNEQGRQLGEWPTYLRPIV